MDEYADPALFRCSLGLKEEGVVLPIRPDKNAWAKPSPTNRALTILITDINIG